MKYLKYFFVAAVVILSPSYTTETSRLSEGIYPGNLIPDFEIKNQLGNEFKLSNLKGKRVLVNFWAAYDAKSHVENVLLWNTLQKENSDIEMLSVSLDRSKSVFNKTLDLDCISTNHHFMLCPEDRPEVYKKYKLERGFKNYLIDENGIVLATNLTPSDLKSWL